jgi:hypothetical protein
MNRHPIKLALLAAGAAALAGTIAVAAEQAPASKPAASAPMNRGMMGSMMGSEGHMDQMMGMMGACQSMMGGGMTGHASMMKLPAGNEKLEAQMHAEMLQKMGEIAAKYADKIKEGK